MTKIWCNAEPGNFPESEFRHDINGQVVIPYIHERGKHHFINGTPVIPVPDPSISIRMQQLQDEMNRLGLEGDPDRETQETQDMAWELHDLARGLPKEDLRDLLDQARNKHDQLSDSGSGTEGEQ